VLCGEKKTFHEAVKVEGVAILLLKLSGERGIFIASWELPGRQESGDRSQESE
jgi:hypothetical protein